VVEDFLTNLLVVLAYQCAGVAIFLPFELAFPKERIPLSRRAGGFIFLLAAAPLGAAVAVIMGDISKALNIQPIPVHLGVFSPVVGAIVLALWLDLQFYVAHRIEHRFFWRFHAVHHSIRDLSAANSYHHWTEALMSLTVAIPLMFFDVKIAPTLGLLVLLFRYQQFYIHSSSRPHFGPLRYVWVDNRYHRIHHSLNPEHFNKNFGAFSPLWDWLFGTLYMPQSKEWPEVGVEGLHQPESIKDWLVAPWRLGVGDERRSEAAGPASDVGNFHASEVARNVARG
jgi:sterol desaturase/sphingolipid hydroxylase (fatty acid hydroxylase superfamily)